MSSGLTPAEERKASLARLKAKNKLKQAAQAAKATRKPTSFVNTAPAQPSSSRNAASAVSSAVKDLESAPLPRDSRLGKYFEYDLSRMHNSKGGFLTEEGEGEKSREQVEREKARERARIQAGEEPAINPETSPRCVHCNTLEVDHQFITVFGVQVCRRCKQKFPELYSLLTKTECKADYLLTDSELADSNLLPHILKSNPHEKAYSNMFLYLRVQVEAFAWKKWDGEEGLDREYERREEVKRVRGEKKFTQQLKDLRRKTRHNAYQVKQDAQHVHQYEDMPTDQVGVVMRVCEECGHTMEVEVV